MVKLIRSIAGPNQPAGAERDHRGRACRRGWRGFADVWPPEVKSLAVQTAAATGRIAAQIAAVQDSANSTVEAIQRNAGRMRESTNTRLAWRPPSRTEHGHGDDRQQRDQLTEHAADGRDPQRSHASAVARNRSIGQEAVSKASVSVEAAVTNLRGKVETRFLSQGRGASVSSPSNTMQLDGVDRFACQCVGMPMPVCRATPPCR